jgi:pyruvate dehydrogenase E2 component (dihydrolipoamide acetyltransferase)
MGMQEGKVLRWFKHEGESVHEGEPLCEVETEKATVEVPSPRSGLLTRIIVEVNSTVPVLEVLAVITSPSEAASAPPAPESPSKSTQPGPTAASLRVSSAQENTRESGPHAQVTPLARRVAKDHGVDLRDVGGSGPGGRITDQDVRRAIANRTQPATLPPVSTEATPRTVRQEPAVQVEPRARRLAHEHGIDLSGVAGSGPGGRISEGDVQRAIANQPPAIDRVTSESLPVTRGRPGWGSLSEPSIISAEGQTGGDEPNEKDSYRDNGGDTAQAVGQVIRLTGMRGVIARRMLESLQTSAQLTLTTDADVTTLVAQRTALRDQFDPTYTDLLIKAAALALRKHPRLNAMVIGQEIRLLPDIHIGVAVALDDGLVVPVVRNADRKPLGAIAREVAELVQRARAGKLTMAEISGGTFTVTNLGGFGIDAFTPILNPPEAAILGVGRIVERLARRTVDLVWRQMMVLSLTIDHRVVDGAPAAAFMQTLRELLERPELFIH